MSVPKRYPWKGGMLTLGEISRQVNVTSNTLRDAICKGRASPDGLEEYVREIMLRRAGKVIRHWDDAPQGETPVEKAAIAICGQIYNGKLLSDAGFRRTGDGAWEFGAEFCLYRLRLRPGNRAELLAFSRRTGGLMMRRLYEIRGDRPVEV